MPFHHRSGNAWLLVAVALGTQSPQPPPAADSPRQQLLKIYEADQSDPRPYGTPDEIKATDGRAQQRRAEVAAILATGQVQSADDFYRAAIVYQHSAVAADQLMAHVLATIAGYRGHKRARWLSAAALDVYLQETKQPQIFGTVYFRNGDRKAFDSAVLSDALREGFCVPPLADQQKNVNLLKSVEPAGHQANRQRVRARRSALIESAPYTG
jgi:hypothetical protein